ncbi:uncharacterized protein ACHE_80741S [Aspergillus chevalieri]|uniref:Uncharacterized protein n=1 Tax=Aspergillus chevalieri TaxID=182096 RepID=A0A7R7ZTG3_ASPCH|nr:uncharacterized protein ACHE_80741S [Aspergillus chevalieri]BCR92841.1 hypothetical protein ACHE_80741S [Aspergillus chevalieri]
MAVSCMSLGGAWIEIYADACEALAASDCAFADHWGVRFHRDQGVTTPGSKRKQGPPPPESSDEANLATPMPALHASKRRRSAHIVRRSTRLMQAGGQEDDEQGEPSIRQNGTVENVMGSE